VVKADRCQQRCEVTAELDTRPLCGLTERYEIRDTARPGETIQVVHQGVVEIEVSGRSQERHERVCDKYMLSLDGINKYAAT